jgi:hypothetical protein
MKSKVKYFSVFLLVMLYTFSFSGCSKLFGPSDEEVIKAINESGYFTGGFGGLTLQPPIVVLEKGSRDKNGFWPVKVKAKFTYFVSKEQTSAPVEKTFIFNMHKAKDNAGNSVWRAALGQ